MPDRPVLDRKELVSQFRLRLLEVIERSGLTRGGFASRIGLDRSTLSQLLSPENERLPRAETIMAVAREGQVSSDWLLGLSQEVRLGAEMVQSAMDIEPGAGSPLDKRLQRWHAEAAGYKIRYVPATLPDLLKTEEVVRYEYGAWGEGHPDSQLEQVEARLLYSRRPETEMEVASSVQKLREFARGQGIYEGFPLAARRRQMERMVDLIDELYPTFRWFLYDGLQRYSVPMNVFGPKRATIYIGGMYFVFNATEHIRVLARHFDELIRAAVVQPHEVADLVRSLMPRVGNRRRPPPTAGDGEGSKEVEA